MTYTENSSPIEILHCWRTGTYSDGTPALSGVCPYSGALVTHSPPSDSRPCRVRHYLGKLGPQTPLEYRLEMHKGRPPKWLRARLRRPLGELDVAHEQIGEGARGIVFDEFDCERRVPAGNDIRFALQALRNVGDARTAHNLQTQLGGLSYRAEMRREASGFWLTMRGKLFREALLSALKAAWDRGGGPARAADADKAFQVPNTPVVVEARA